MAYSLTNRRNSQNKLFDERKKVLVSAIGGEVFIRGNYKHHVFKSTDTFKVMYRTTSSIVFDYVLVGGSQNGFAGSYGNGAGGKGGSGSLKIGISENFNKFNPRVDYTVTVGGAGSVSTIATNGATITSAGSWTTAGNGGSSFAGNVNGGACSVEEVYEENCCCYDCSNDGVTCCDGNPDCDTYGAQYCGCCRGSCDFGDPGTACGWSWVCPSGQYCDTCGSESNGGGAGSGGATGDLVLYGPLDPNDPTYGYWGYGAGGGGGGGGGGGSGGPNGGYANGQAGLDAPQNSGIGGGGGGAGADCSCTENACGVSVGCSNEGAGGAGGLGASGIVFIVYKFQE